MMTTTIHGETFIQKPVNERTMIFDKLEPFSDN